MSQGGRGSAPFDSEGVATAPRDVVRDGVVQGYFLGSYSARKLGLQTTGNAGGSHNLTISSKLTTKGDDFAGMIRKMGRGLLVTELMDPFSTMDMEWVAARSGNWLFHCHLAFHAVADARYTIGFDAHNHHSGDAAKHMARSADSGIEDATLLADNAQSADARAALGRGAARRCQPARVRPPRAYPGPGRRASRGPAGARAARAAAMPGRPARRLR